MFDFIRNRFRRKPKPSAVDRARASPTISSVEPSPSMLDPLNPLSPFTPFNQFDSYSSSPEPIRSSSCDASSSGGYDSGGYSSSDSCSSSGSDSGSSSCSSD